jgi:glycosyltransferase involved in cell wall biosynthesis
MTEYAIPRKMTFGENSGLRPDREFFLGPNRPPKLAVCIPACNEESLIPVIQNLMDCVQIENLLVCVVINASEDATEVCRRQNALTFETLVAFLQSQNPEFSIHVALYNAIPAKKSGVGMARKLAMDKACSLSESTNSDTVLLCLDSDCQVEENYLKAVAGYFAVRKNVLAASVYFEHPLPEDHQLRESITSYELHLRYLKNALQWAGYPWYFHTVGSSMAVRARTYLASGGSPIQRPCAVWNRQKYVGTAQWGESAHLQFSIVSGIATIF